VPEIIHYNNNNLKQRIIRFIFETRNDVEKKYVYGSLETRNKRLKSVIAASNAYCVFDYCSNGDQIRRYTLDYKYSAASGRSLLQSIQEFGSDDMTSLPAQNFTYSEPNTSNVALSNSSITADFRESMSFDINGDSLTDILRYQGMGPNVLVGYQLSNGNGFGALKGHQTFPFGQWKLLTGDFNGDGYKDLIFAKGTSVKVKHLIMLMVVINPAEVWISNNLVLKSLFQKWMTQVIILFSISGKIQISRDCFTKKYGIMEIIS
jgi:hypothetical protein